jgi:hypothetical protein
MSEKPENDTPSRLHKALRVYQDDRKAFLGWVGTTLGAIAIGAAGFAHGKLWAHETDIAVLRSETSVLKESLQEQKAMLREILTKMPRQP